MVFVWIGIAFAVIVLAVLLRDDLRLLIGPRQRTQGRVIGHRKSESDGISYTAQVEFTDLDGITHVVEDSIGGQMPTPPVGAMLGVMYPAKCPAKGRVHRPLLRAFLYIMMLAMLAPLLAKAFGWISG